VGSQERSLKLLPSGLGVAGEEDLGKGSCLVGRGRVKVHQRELLSETLVLYKGTSEGRNSVGRLESMIEQSLGEGGSS
jgi:hypothetical protein